VGRRIEPAPLRDVSVNSGFWAFREATNRSTTIPLIYKRLKETGRFDAMSLSVERTGPHQFYDSDVAKWIEAVAYSLQAGPDPEMEARVDQYVDLMADAQADDGYLNSYYQTVAPDQRWTNLRNMHELYVAGHLIEAAVAYHQATGKGKMLGIVRRLADHIAGRFGPREGQERGYPGHPEIELALVRLWREVGDRRYLDLATYFVDERGREPNYFVEEARRRNDAPPRWYVHKAEYSQADLPVRQRDEPVGHAVRAMYLYSGMVDTAVENDDAELLDVCRRLWKNVTAKQMYITGGIGSTVVGERFTFDYDLPNETAYAETCAAIALVFFSQRLLSVERDAKYADLVEHVLYNAVLPGISLDGRAFFYSNPLSVYPRARESAHSHVAAVRQEMFETFCCPPNVARLIGSLGDYVLGVEDETLYVHQYVGCEAGVSVGPHPIRLTMRSGFPFQGRAEIAVGVEAPGQFEIALRIPGWCESPRLDVAGEPVRIDAVSERGYARIKRLWHDGDTIVVDCPMTLRRMYSHPQVRMNNGKVALMRGPLVYCLEEVDNGPGLSAICLPRAAELKEEPFPLVDNGVAIRTRGFRDAPPEDPGPLYRSEPPATAMADILAVPYFLWNNRAAGEMMVWIRECAGAAEESQ